MIPISLLSILSIKWKKLSIKPNLVVIAKNENLYIREFIEYYFLIGVDNIILCDNNDLDGESFEYILKNFINSGFVKILNYRGKKNFQIISYQEVYLKYLNNYNWFMFFDVDEYLILPKFLYIWISNSLLPVSIIYFILFKKNIYILNIKWLIEMNIIYLMKMK